MLAFFFLTHGTQKLFGVPATEAMKTVALGSLPGLAGVLEFGGGLLLLIGLFTRPVALILSGEMAALYCFVWLYIAFRGPGPWSVDALRRRGAAKR